MVQKEEQAKKEVPAVTNQVPATQIPPEIDTARIEKQMDAELHRRYLILKSFKKRLKPNDVTLFGDHVHYEVGFARDILSVAGISVLNPRFERTLLHKDTNEFTVRCIITLERSGTRFDVPGSAISTDDFFRKRKDRTGKVYTLPLDETKVNHIEMKAHSNALTRAMNILLGLRGTRAELQELGIDTNKLKRVSFKGGAKSSPSKSYTNPTSTPASSERSNPSAPASALTEKRKEISESWRRLKEVTDEEDMDLSGRLPKYGVPGLLAKDIAQADRVLKALKAMIADAEKGELKDGDSAD